MSQKTILVLTPEFGGARYGPFGRGTVSIGTDASRCQIVLHPSTGAYPVHAMLTDTGSAWQLQPAQVGAPLFVRTQGRIRPVQGYANLAELDQIVIGSHQGVSLIVQRVVPTAGPSATTGAGTRGVGAQVKSRVNSNAFSREIWRQLESTLVTLPYGRDIYRFVSRARTGVFFRPRNLIAGGIALVGLLGMGCFGCFSSIIGTLAVMMNS